MLRLSRRLERLPSGLYLLSVSQQDVPDWMGANVASSGATPTSGSYSLTALQTLHILTATVGRAYLLFSLNIQGPAGGAIRYNWQSSSGTVYQQVDNSVVKNINTQMFGTKMPLGDGLDVVNLFNLAQSSTDTYALVYGYVTGSA